MKHAVLSLSLLVAPVGLAAQEQGGLDPATLLKPLAESWPTYSGDYSGRRYSRLDEINASTVKGLGLAWTAELKGGPPSAPGGFGSFGRRGHSRRRGRRRHERVLGVA